MQAAKINATLAYERQVLGKQSLEGAERDVETAQAALRGLEAEQEAAEEATHQAQAALQEQVCTFTVWICLLTLHSSMRGLGAEQEAAQEATHQAQAALQEQVRSAAQGI